MRRLGDYIRQVDVRNRNLEVTNLVGLSIDKVYIPSVANTVGTDLSNYKIIRKNQFACSLMQVSRDKKMPIAVYKGEDAIMSPAYPIFEITDKSLLLPDYLHLWFVRPEFDREVTFYAVGGVRGSLEWDDFCDLQIPVPPIEEQREIVARHKAIEHKIDINRRLIAKLEETARTIYRHTFVEDIDPENLPDGWVLKSVNELASSFRGVSYTSNDELQNPNDIGINGVLVVRGNNINNSHFVEDADKVYIPKGMTTFENYIHQWDIIMTMSSGSPKHIGKCFLSYNNMDCVYGAFLNKFKPLQEAQFLLYLFFTSWQFYLAVKQNANGTGIDNLTLKVFDDIMIPYNREEVNTFNISVGPIFSVISSLDKQNIMLERTKINLIDKLSAL